MQKIVFMRHSEPDYSFVENRKFIGHGIELAHLSEDGIQMAERASFDSRLDHSGIIISSPYTRALQTAAIISKNRQLSIKVELDLHEWIPDLTYQYSSHKEASEARKLCFKHNGVRPNDSEVKFENLEDVFNRVKKVLLRYKEYKKIIVVTHGLVIRRFAFAPDIPYCGILEIDFNESITCTPFKSY